MEALGMCAACTRKPAKYICPKCSSVTCSLPCYKGHNSDCLEAFYQSQVLSELKNRRADERTQREMHEILHSLCPAYEDEDLPQGGISDDRLEYILEHCGEPGIAEKLTYSEQMAFAKYIRSRECLQELGEFAPWWEGEDQPNYEVTDIDNPAVNDYIALPPLRSLSAKAPSPVLPYHIINAIWAVAYTWRLHNGDIDDSPELLLQHLLAVSEALRGTADSAMATASLALLDAQKDAIAADGAVAKGFIPLVDTDTQTIISGKSLAVASFFHVRDMLAAVAAGKSIASKAKRAAERLKPKVLYYLSYLKSQSRDLFSTLSREVEAASHSRETTEG